MESGFSRVQLIVARLLKPAQGAAWVLGIFDPDGDLLDFTVSGAALSRKTALRLLCTMPLPESPGSISLKVTAKDGTIASDLAAATMLEDGQSLIFIARKPATTDKVWSGVARKLQAAVRQIAVVIASDLAPAIERRQASLSLREQPGFFLLTPEFDVAMEWHPRDAISIELAELTAPHAGRLPPLLERTVRRLTKSWDFTRIETCEAGVAHPIPGLALRVAPMRGAGVLIGVFVEPHAARHSMHLAAATLGVSAREREVLHALLDGHSVADIAAILKLAESTVNDYIARLIQKTNARNRIEMAAKLLGWPAVRPEMLAQTKARVRKRPGDAPVPLDTSREKPRARVSWRHKIHVTTTGDVRA